MNDNAQHDPRLYAIPDIHGHAKGEHKSFSDERPIPLSARMLFLWFFHACRRGWPRFMMVTDHMNYLTFEDPAAINLVRRALKLAQAGDLYGAAETASVEVGHAAVVSEGLRRGMRYSIGAEVDNDPRSRPDAQNIVDAMKPDGMIRSVHFLTIDHPTHGPNWNWPFDNPEFADVHDLVGTAKTWELYMATLLDAIERLPGNIVGHFYVPARFGHWPDDATLDAYENQLVDACEARGMAIELNTRFLYRDHSDEEKARYLNAHRRLLAKCKAKNVGIAVGSDAHSPKDQGGAFETVLALLDECEINELVFPIAGRLARVALRVERKAEPPPEPPVVPEERKAPRKPRPTEPAPDPAATTAPPAPPAAAGEAEPPPAKAKSRPKRSRAKTPDAAEPNETGADAVAEPETAAVPGTVTVVSGSVATDEPALASVIAEDAPAAIAPLHAEPAVPELAPVPAAIPAETEPAELAAIHVAPPVEVIQETLSDGLSDIVIDAEFAPIVASDPGGPASSEAAHFHAAVGAEFLVSAPEPQPVAEAEPEPAEADPKPVVRKSRPKPPPKTRVAPARAKSAANARPAAKKAAKPVAKIAAKKTAVKKSAAKKVAVKAVAKKSAVSKAPVKKTVAKKTAVRGSAVKKTAVKKSAAKKSSAKKPAQRRR